MRALVVEDSGTIRMILRLMLKKFGFETFEATNGLEALQRLKEIGTPDLVLVDWNMPEMDGLDFVRAVRANPAYDALPLVMVTTNVEAEQRIAALKAGANGYITKPFTAEAIHTRLGLLGLLQP